MFLFKFAFKNLTRHKRRTFITAFSLAFGLVIFILLDSMLMGAYEQSNINLIDSETGYGKIMTSETFNDLKFLPISNRVENPDKIIKFVDSLGANAVKRVTIKGEMIYTDDYFPKSGSTAVTFIGVEPKKDIKVYNIFNKKNLVKGRFIEEGRDEVVLGSWLAEDVGASVGSVFTLALRTASDGDDPGFYQTIDVEVVGIVNVDSPVINRQGVFFPLDMADYYLDLNGAVTDVGVRLPFGYSISKFSKDIKDKLPKELGFYSWRELAADYIAMTEAKSGGSKIFIFLVIIIAVVGISNTMLMTINERQRELGMMRALGMSDKEIRITFIIEAAGIGFIGSILGVSLAIIFNIPLVDNGLDFSHLFRDVNMGYRLSTRIKGLWNIKTIVIAFVLGVIIPIFVSIKPTSRATKKSIPDCLNRR